MATVKRNMYRQSHPIDAYPFEAFSCDSWRIVERVRIRDGSITMHFENPGFEIDDNVPIGNLRIRSRKATLSDCTCFLRPGIDVCVLSTNPSKSSGQESLQSVWVDAKINSIERKPHGSRCTCRFYVIFYITGDPSGTKGKLGRETSEVEIDCISIIQQLERKPCEDGYYRWGYSLDCSYAHEAKLFRGQFSADVSWLLVTSIWKGLKFDVRSVLNKVVYQILDGDQDMTSSETSKNGLAINFRLNDGILRPCTRRFVPVVPSDTFVSTGTVELGPVHEMQSSLLSFYELVDLRRSKRRNVQPERFVSYGGFSKEKPCVVRTETGKINKWKQEETLAAKSHQAVNGQLICLDFFKQSVGGEKMVHTKREDFGKKFLLSEVKPRDVKSGVANRRENQTQLTKKHKKVKTTAAFERPVEDKGFSRGVPYSIFVSEGNKKTEKSSVSNRAVTTKKRNHAVTAVSTPKTSSGIPLLSCSASLLNQRNHPPIKILGDPVEMVSKFSSKLGCRNGSSVLKKRTLLEKKHRETESGWKIKGSNKRLQRKMNYSLGSVRRKFCETRTWRQKFLSAHESKQMIKSWMMNIEFEFKREHPQVVAQWEAIQATNYSNQRWGHNWRSLVIDQAENSELEVLWKEMELSMATNYFLEKSQGSSVELCNMVLEKSNCDGQSCQHEYKLDEEIGIVCQLCSFVSTEIRDVSLPFLQTTGWITNKEHCDEEESGLSMAEHWDLDLFCNPVSSKDVSLSERNDNVWALIPDLRMKLHLHQKKAFEFLWRNIVGSLTPANMEAGSKKTGGCVISHSPGAGKSLLVISFLVSYLKLFPGKRPLILAPKTTLYTWCKEMKKWDVPFPVYQIHVRANYRNEIHNQEVGELLGNLRPNQDDQHVMDCLEKIQKWHQHPSVLLMGYTSFLSLTREESMVEHRRYMGRVLIQSPGILILDEGHNPRSNKSRLRKALMRVETDLRILLSGTLFQNNFTEYFNTLCLARPRFIYEVLRKLDPNVKNRKRKKSSDISMETLARRLFKEKIANKINSRVPEERKHGLNMLRNITKDFIDVYEGGASDTLPGLQSYTLLMKSTVTQQYILSKLQNHKVTYKGYPLELELLITLGSIHPWLITTVGCVNKYLIKKELEKLEKYRIDVNQGSKVRFVVNLVNGCIMKGEKVLIFCRNIAPINLLVEIFERIFAWQRGEEVLVLQGDQELFERAKVIDKFEESGGPSRVLFVSISACAEGISLTAASRVVLLDSEWNPSKTKQAIARAFRPGQERVVYVYRLLASGTLEEDKYRMTTWKEWVSNMIFNEAFVEDPSRRQAENIDDDILREIVEDQANSFHMIMKHEKLLNSLDRGKKATLFSCKLS